MRTYRVGMDVCLDDRMTESDFAATVMWIEAGMASPSP